MLFNDTKVQPPSDLEASRNTSIWIQYFNSSQDLEQIVFPQAIAVGFLKVQLDIFGSLSLAEVEIYSSKMNSLRYYDRGSPVVSSTITKPYQADQPLDSTFKYVDFTGLWHLQIQQKSDTSSLDVPGGWEGAYGTISDFVIIITDLSGTVFTFYQDLVAEITSLPNHGSLYVTSRDNSSFWDFQEAFQMDPEYRIGTREGSGLPLGLCYKDPGCLSKSGKGPLLDFRHLLGATPSLNFLRDERVVVYVPDAGFLGSDSLTYVVHQGTQLQQHVSFNGQSGSLNEVTMNIRNCRRYQQETVNGYTTSPQALCSCAFNSTVTSAAISSCGAAVLSMCSSTDLSSNVFVNMCESCGLSIAQMTLNMSSQTSGACSTEIYRAVWFVLDRGICSANPRRDCISESFTESGRDVRNYLSLKPPLLYGSISALGNSFGGYGWFDTAVLDSS